MSKNGSMRVGLANSIRSARDEVAVALEQQLAAVDVGAAEHQRPVVGAAQRQLGARDQAGGRMIDAQRRRRLDAQVEAQRERGRCRRRRRRRPARGDETENARALRVHGLDPQSVADTDRAGEQRTAGGAAQGQVRVELGAEALGIPHAHVAPDRREGIAFDRAGLEADPAAEGHRSPAQAPGQPVQADAAGVELHLAIHLVDRVRQAEVAQPSMRDERRSRRSRARGPTR